MSDSKHQVTKVKRAYKRRAQPDSDENCSPGNWNKPMNDWNNQGIRTPLGELSNNYMTTLTQNTNVFESSVKRKSREHSISYGNTDPINITRRNERERNRVKLLNMGFDRLRAVVPCHSGEQLVKFPP
ncbi:unnamed protein product [Heterobilharzia americana]|nr:unnamed protein product [Heterobilharzia americana]